MDKKLWKILALFTDSLWKHKGLIVLLYIKDLQKFLYLYLQLYTSYDLG